MNSYTTFIAPPVFGGNQLKLNIPALPVCSGELHAAVAASPHGSFLARRPQIALRCTECLRAKMLEPWRLPDRITSTSTWVVAASAGLPQAIGTAAVQQILADAFNPGRVNYDDPRYEYDGVAGTFGDACRQADRQYRQLAAREVPSGCRVRFPESTNRCGLSIAC